MGRPVHVTGGVLAVRGPVVAGAGHSPPGAGLGGLGLALLAQVVAGRAGWWLAFLALVFAVPALVLYTASIAVFALVLAGLRLVRSQQRA